MRNEYEQLFIEGPELIKHYLSDEFWVLSDPADWGVIEKPKEKEIGDLNLHELRPTIEEFVIDLANHRDITDVDHKNFGPVEVVTFHWHNPRGKQYPGMHYKFDVWTNGPATYYEPIRWYDTPYSG